MLPVSLLHWSLAMSSYCHGEKKLTIGYTHTTEIDRVLLEQNIRNIFSTSRVPALRNVITMLAIEMGPEPVQ